MTELMLHGSHDVAFCEQTRRKKTCSGLTSTWTEVETRFCLTRSSPGHLIGRSRGLWRVCAKPPTEHAGSASTLGCTGRAKQRHPGQSTNRARPPVGLSHPEGNGTRLGCRLNGVKSRPLPLRPHRLNASSPPTDSLLISHW
ncbi:unnamed protein product [Protopolystoma xenopodis]|uniref:Uncharacterized protein n=1 Tax=Protopolystoma xenopodis TaxID=117903 RepID=A0A448XSV4_9PLAT|nr:unnamed protein product [Protopolystoma xenopodis]